MEQEPISPITEEEIYAEINNARESHSGLLGYFNNFFMYLPGQTYRHSYENYGIMENKPDPSNRGQKSPLRMTQTWSEFFRTIDDMLETNGISLEELEEQLKSRANDEKVAELIIPTYVDLRLLGYNRLDFWS